MATLYDRTQMLIGEEALNKLKCSKIIVFGIGGVGGFAVEAFARAGIGNITLVDYDIIDITNINRQIIALHSTISRKKTEVMKERINDINPDINVITISEKLTKDNIADFNLEGYDYILDAIDDVQAKLTLISYAKSKRIPIICSMGTGNKVDPSRFVVTDISKTHTCPLAKAIRKKVKEMGVDELKVLFSPELSNREEYSVDGSRPPASISFVPSVAGLLLASEVVKALVNHER